MKVRVRAINRFFNIVLGALAMFAVFLTSAFISMRLFIHGREVKVPILIGQDLNHASDQARTLGLRLTLEDRFYSNNAAPGVVLGQSPAAGTTVRRQSTVRVTESLGPQQVAVPDLIGESERTASINLRRVQLEVGTIAYVQAPGDPGTVSAQTPEANASGIDRPRVSLLVSAPQGFSTNTLDTAGAAATGQNTAPSANAGANQAANQGPAFVMPSLVGLPLVSAAARASAVGLRIVSAEEVRPAAPASATTATATSGTSSAPAATAAPAAPIAGASTSTVVAQTPPAGYRVTKSDAVHLSIAY